MKQKIKLSLTFNFLNNKIKVIVEVPKVITSVNIILKEG
jgi:hypothetical protein